MEMKYRVMLFCGLYAIAATCIGFANILSGMETGAAFSPAGVVLISLFVALVGTFGIFIEDRHEP